MRVFISADMEGVTGVVHADELTKGHADWERARTWMTHDVIAAAEGAMAAGATEVLVTDGHAGMRNLVFDELPAGVVAHRGPASGRTMCQVEGLDESFDCVLLVGYHAMAGSEGLLSHTWHGGMITQFRLNGRPVGESAITASVAGHHGVPVVLAVGDQYLATEAEQFVPGIHTVIVKETTGVQNARCRPAAETLPEIRDAAERAVRGRAAVSPAITENPVRIELDLVAIRQARQMERFRGADVERVGATTVAFGGSDVLEALELAWLLVELADMELGVWNR
jgi:D-amino peptidase